MEQPQQPPLGTDHADDCKCADCIAESRTRRAGPRLYDRAYAGVAGMARDPDTGPTWMVDQAKHAGVDLEVAHRSVGTKMHFSDEDAYTIGLALLRNSTFDPGWEAIRGRELPDDEDLMRRLVQHPPLSKEGPLPRWSHVGHAFSVGSTTATALCRRFGVEPDEQLGEWPDEELGEDEY